MRLTLPVLLVIIFFGLLVFPCPGQQIKDPGDVFLEDAIDKGLKNDFFPVHAVDYLLQNESRFFVSKCPICTPVKRAFKNYAKYLKESEASDFRGNYERLEALFSSDKQTTQEAFKELIADYVKDFKQTGSLGETEAQALYETFLTRREQGMSYKSANFGDFCPSCDGVCEK